MTLGRIILGVTMLLSCDADEQECEHGLNLECGSITWSDSDYVLPYPKGNTYRVNQGNNNTCGGHQGPYIYGYDFDMPIGSIVVASRAGEVTEIRTDNPDGQNLILGNENVVKLLHDDGTTSAYSHLQQFSIVVTPGAFVKQGDTLGRSGNSGYTGDFPHLHFHLSTCDEPTTPGCKTILVKFSNAKSNPCGLVQNEFYEAY